MNFNKKTIMPRVSSKLCIFGFEIAGLIHNNHYEIRGNCVIRKLRRGEHV
jgi:hypothetical protein